MASFIIYIIRWGLVLTLLYSFFGLMMKRETLHHVNRVVLLTILITSMVLPLCQIETNETNIVAKGREMIECQIQNVHSPLLTDVADFSDWENLLFKFELNIPAANGWAAGMLQIIPAGLDKISGSGAGVDIYGNTVAGANNSFFKSFDDGGSNVRRGLYQPWTTADDGIYHTDSQWITVSIPLKNFIYGIDGTESTAPKLTPESFTSLTLFILGGKEGKECNPVFKFDNIRVVPAK